LFENGVLRKKFGLKMDEVTGEWIILADEELYDLYSSSNIIRVIETSWWLRHVECTREWRGTCRLLVGITKRKMQLESPMRRWESNIKIDLQEILWNIGLSGSGSG
jgi:hypothetical protein